MVFISDGSNQVYRKRGFIDRQFINRQKYLLVNMRWHALLLTLIMWLKIKKKNKYSLNKKFYNN